MGAEVYSLTLYNYGYDSDDLIRIGYGIQLVASHHSLVTGIDFHQMIRMFLAIEVGFESPNFVSSDLSIMADRINHIESPCRVKAG